MSRVPRRLLVLAGLVACLAAAAGCRDEKNLKILETQRDMILDRTRPKQEFWDQVGRKGEALKKEHAADAELVSLRAQISQAQGSLAQAQAQLESARATNAKTSAVLSAQLVQLEQAEHSAAEHEAELAGFQARQRSGEAP